MKLTGLLARIDTLLRQCGYRRAFFMTVKAVSAQYGFIVPP
jgi:hypothetical protein